MKNNFMEILKMRRSRYVLKKESSLKNDEIVKIIEESVLHTPSSFNSQSSRVAILFGKEHEKLWEITTEILRKTVNNEKQFQSTQKKMDAFRGAYGTVLFFEDQEVIKGLQANFPLYKDVFPIWSYESAGMLNLVVWTAFAENGIGASLQHYNPLIDDAVKKEFRIPTNWKLIAQMPFGKSNAPDPEKTFLPVEKRVLVFGNKPE